MDAAECCPGMHPRREVLQKKHDIQGPANLSERGSQGFFELAALQSLQGNTRQVDGDDPPVAQDLRPIVLDGALG